MSTRALWRLIRQSELGVERVSGPVLLTSDLGSTWAVRPDGTVLVKMDVERCEPRLSGLRAHGTVQGRDRRGKLVEEWEETWHLEVWR